MSAWAIVVAAGGGTRFGGRKQFHELAGGRVVDRSVAAARAAVEGTVVVLPSGYEWDGSPVDAAVGGGDTRAASVRAGLDAVPLSVDIIVVHDAARPLASAELFRSVIGAVASGADGAIPAVPLADTIKRVEGSRAVETLARDTLVAVQTPQAFRAEFLRRAHRCGGEATDDAAMVEADGGVVVVVPGEVSNRKITTPGDLEIAAYILSEQARR
ncbi:MAG TPA: 2-C-methyl-D-erythritol 4-phosphate cytidylyltransferase [Acidimicrobiia bacterium]|nr:2-C-methyl-D-erythritol 4-phosphate cytidylyltransferase [Acidimicrobiia bacterium]